MSTSHLLCIVVLLLAGAVRADPVPVSPAAEAAYQVDHQEGEDWRLDPAIFVDISAVDVPEVAVKLPQDQVDGEVP